MKIVIDISEEAFEIMKHNVAIGKPLCSLSEDKMVSIVANGTPLSNEWIPVKENIPIVGEDVLVCDFDGDVYISFLHFDGGWGFDVCGNTIKNVVAWMPLPKPYDTESEDKT